MDWKSNFVAIDTETTGFGPEARILEVGLALFQRYDEVLYRLTDTWSSLVNPGDSIDWDSEMIKGATRVNHITKEMVSRFPPFDEVFAQMCQRLAASTTWVGHNINFDLQMLKQERARFQSTSGAQADASVPRPLVVLDTCSMDYHFDTGEHSHDLESTARRLGIRIDNAHRALDDAIVAGAIAGHLLPRMWNSHAKALALIAQAKQEFDSYRASRRRS